MNGPPLRVLLWVIAGVLAAVLLPVLGEAVREGTGAASSLVAMPGWLRKALIFAAFGIVAGIASLAVWMSQQPDPPPEIKWQTAFLVGFGYEAALEKFLGSAG
jgi:hypothetical protein